MINSLVPAIEAYLSIFFNLPYSVLTFIYFCFAVALILGLLKIFMG